MPAMILGNEKRKIRMENLDNYDGIMHLWEFHMNMWIVEGE